MNENETIQLSEAAIDAIKGLQHSAGTYQYYRTTLDRLFYTVLRYYDCMGMDDLEAITTVRAIDDLRLGLAAIAGYVASNGHSSDATKEEIAIRVEDSFAGIDEFEEPNPTSSTESA